MPNIPSPLYQFPLGSAEDAYPNPLTIQRLQEEADNPPDPEQLLTYQLDRRPLARYAFGNTPTYYNSDIDPDSLRISSASTPDGPKYRTVGMYNLSDTSDYGKGIVMFPGAANNAATAYTHELEHAGRDSLGVPLTSVYDEEARVSQGDRMYGFPNSYRGAFNSIPDRMMAAHNRATMDDEALRMLNAERRNNYVVGASGERRQLPKNMLPSSPVRGQERFREQMSPYLPGQASVPLYERLAAYQQPLQGPPTPAVPTQQPLRASPQLTVPQQLPRPQYQMMPGRLPVQPSTVNIAPEQPYKIPQGQRPYFSSPVQRGAEPASVARQQQGVEFTAPGQAYINPLGAPVQKAIPMPVVNTMQVQAVRPAPVQAAPVQAAPVQAAPNHPNTPVVVQGSRFSTPPRFPAGTPERPSTPSQPTVVPTRPVQQATPPQAPVKAPTWNVPTRFETPPNPPAWTPPSAARTFGFNEADAYKAQNANAVAARNEMVKQGGLQEGIRPDGTRFWRTR
jgi:hypothetical protein